jgi:N,N'-diacetyllegionaminate synthase
MIKALELSPRAHETVAAHCRAKGIRFLSTPFDALSADRLAAMGMAVIKIPSGEITNLPYLRHLGGMGLPLIVSTGMSTLDEVRAAGRSWSRPGPPVRT